MKKKFLLLIFIFIPLVAFTQQGWTWMHGDTIISNPGIFGTQGVSDPANNPPAVYEPCEWVDHNGKFWLLGGDSYNTLWKYDPVTNAWTWMHGSNSPGQYGSYGVQGVSSPSNHPGGRQAATTWVDLNGNLWLFGGYGFGAGGFQNGLNDLWKYELANNEWTWISGSTSGGSLGIYGIQGVPDPANSPPARLETAAAWADSLNNLWFFGGQLCCSANGYIDDVWKYDMATNEWTWIKGSNTTGHLPVYGIKGIPDAANTPGARRIYAHWKDKANNFWLFGGQSSFGSACYNDLWKYNPATNEWTWMKGSNVTDSQGSFGTSCTFDSLNEPPARMENRFYWTDSCNNFWMFGGLNTTFGNYRNDLWSYAPDTNQWKWVSGSSASDENGHYGIQGVADVNNHPGARYGGVAWLGPNESFWLFGGVGYPYNNNVGDLNDLWRFVPDSSCVFCEVLVLPGTAFASSDTSLCQKFCIDFFDQSTNNPTSWIWNFPGADPVSSTNKNPTDICYNFPGIYDVTLIATNSYGSDTITLANYITVNATPPIPAITQIGYTLTSSPATSYQWQFNAADIPGATNQSYDVLQTGFYTVVVGDLNECKNSTTLYVEITGIPAVNSDWNVYVYPNPSSGTFTIEILNAGITGDISIDVVNTLGQKVFSSSEKIGTSGVKKEIDLRGNDTKFCVPTGVYFIEIKTQDVFLKKKMIIIK